MFECLLNVLKWVTSDQESAGSGNMLRYCCHLWFSMRTTTPGKSIDGEWKRTYFSFYRYWKWNKGKASNKNPQSFL